MQDYLYTKIIWSFYILLQGIVDATTYGLILGDRGVDSCFTRGFEKMKESLGLILGDKKEDSCCRRGFEKMKESFSCTKSDDIETACSESETETRYVQT